MTKENLDRIISGQIVLNFEQCTEAFKRVCGGDAWTNLEIAMWAMQGLLSSEDREWCRNNLLPIPILQWPYVLAVHRGYKEEK